MSNNAKVTLNGVIFERPQCVAHDRPDNDPLIRQDSLKSSAGRFAMLELWRHTPVLDCRTPALDLTVYKWLAGGNGQDFLSAKSGFAPAAGNPAPVIRDKIALSITL